VATLQVGEVIPGGKNRLGFVTSYHLPPGDVAGEARALGHPTREAASTSLRQVLFSGVSYVRGPTSREWSTGGNGIWTNDNCKRVSDHRPVSTVGQNMKEAMTVGAAPTPHVTPAIRTMSMFQPHLLNPEDKETIEKVLFE
jgi:hypothetical protein